MRRKTRIAGLHFSDARPVKGEKVVITGYLQWYDEELKSWQPAEHKKVELIVDGEKIEESVTDTDGKFVFEVSLTGEHELEFVFNGTPLLEGCRVRKKVAAMSEEKKKSILKIAKLVFILFTLMLAAVLAIAFLLSRGRV